MAERRNWLSGTVHAWPRTLRAAVLASLALPGAMMLGAGGEPVVPAKAAAATGQVEQLRPIAGIRRLSEAQYRHIIADVFGPDIRVAGRFEPLVRPVHQLIATGGAVASISPTGMEQFDAVGRGVAAQVFDAAHRKAFVPCAPRDEAAADADCAAKTLGNLGRYLFRRPLTAQELAEYTGMAGRSAAQTGSFYTGLQLALSAMLVSPDFLYVVETAEPDPTRAGEYRLDSYARASRLSFLLWDTAPSRELLDAAEQGRLMDDAQFAAIARKMVASPRLEDGVRAFFADMLMFEKFDDMSKDTVVFPRFNQNVLKAFPEQILRTIVDQLVTRRGDYRELFTTRRTFVNRTLGPLYDVPINPALEWTPVEFGPNDDRAGLLSQAGFLALYSHSGRSSPTLRGRAIRELLLCQPVPDPPGNVDFKAVNETTNKAMPTARIRLGEHATNPVCAGCHKITDPIGLSLEKFDGVGAFRSTENDAPIDISGSFEQTKFSSVAGLGKALAASKSTTECVTGRALEYAVGRPLDDDSMVLAQALEKGFESDGYNFPALMLRIATMPEAYRVKLGAPGTPGHVAMLQSSKGQGRNR